MLDSALNRLVARIAPASTGRSARARARPRRACAAGRRTAPCRRPELVRGVLGPERSNSTSSGRILPGRWRASARAMCRPGPEARAVRAPQAWATNAARERRDELDEIGSKPTDERRREERLELAQVRSPLRRVARPRSLPARRAGDRACVVERVFAQEALAAVGVHRQQTMIIELSGEAWANAIDSW